jgi:hypothetical protein
MGADEGAAYFDFEILTTPKEAEWRSGGALCFASSAAKAMSGVLPTAIQSASATANQNCIACVSPPKMPVSISEISIFLRAISTATHAPPE